MRGILNIKPREMGERKLGNERMERFLSLMRRGSVDAPRLDFLIEISSLENSLLCGTAIIGEGRLRG